MYVYVPYMCIPSVLHRGNGCVLCVLCVCVCVCVYLPLLFLRSHDALPSSPLTRPPPQGCHEDTRLPASAIYNDLLRQVLGNAPPRLCLVLQTNQTKIVVSVQNHGGDLIQQFLLKYEEKREGFNLKLFYSVVFVCLVLSAPSRWWLVAGDNSFRVYPCSLPYQ